jgi:pimeloyl-ACP methyl ester carboxylesterase
VPPTLVPRGADSIVSTPEGTAALADGLPDREVREIKDGSHMLVLEHPEEVAALIRNCISARWHN